MKGPFVTPFAGLILLVLASPSWARLQAAGPDALLSNSDLHSQEQALQNALEYKKTGYHTTWVNPETGHRGRVTTTSTYKNSAGQDCRKYQRSLTIDGRAAIGHGTRCRTRNGIWIVPQPIYVQQPYYPRSYYPYYPYYSGSPFPFTISLGYYFGHYFGHSGRHGNRNRGGRQHGRRGHRR